MTAPTLITIHDIDHQGRGVGRMVQQKTNQENADNELMIVFVSGALPNEVVFATGFSKKKKFLQAKLLSIEKKSSQRVEAGCPHFSMCGGCAQQHLDERAQVAYKHRAFEESFARLAGIKPENFSAPIYGPTWHYRRRARLSVKFVEKKNRVLVGFHEKGGRFIADIKSCKVLAKPFGELIMPLADMIGLMYAKRKIAQLEISVGDTAELQPAPLMVVRHLVDLEPHDINLLRSFSEKYAVAVYLQGNDKRVNLLTPDNYTPFYYLPEQGIRLAFAPSDFIQVNAIGNQALVTRALNWLDIQKNDRVLDAFCGLGNFSLPLAKAINNSNKVPSVVGIEGDLNLVKRAQSNLALNCLEARASFFVDNLFEPSEKTINTLQEVNKVLLDPPRDGAEKLCRLIPDNVCRIVYVSCHPATLARDAAILVASGFRCIEAGVVNLFPHTNHIESIALFVR